MGVLPTSASPPPPARRSGRVTAARRWPALAQNGTSPSGCVMGRIGGRTSNASFVVDGVRYQLEANSGGGKHTMHSGNAGCAAARAAACATAATCKCAQVESRVTIALTLCSFNRVDWTVLPGATAACVALGYESPDGEQGFPGNLSARVEYCLTDANELVMSERAAAGVAAALPQAASVPAPPAQLPSAPAAQLLSPSRPAPPCPPRPLRPDITATTTKATPLSIWNHPYFNLAGFSNATGANNTILDHNLTLIS